MLSLEDKSLNSILLGFIAVFLVGVILMELRVVLLPFFVSILLSFIFQPIVLSLKKKNVPIVVILLIVLLILAGVLTAISVLILPSLTSFAGQFSGDYIAGIKDLVRSAENELKVYATTFGFDFDDRSIVDSIDFSAVASIVSGGIGSLLNFFSNIFLVVLFMLFILAGSGELVTKIGWAFPEQTATRITDVTIKINDQVRQYLVAKTIVSAITGFLIFLVLWVFNIKFAVLWGFLAFLLNYIPNIGSLAAVVLPFGQAALQVTSGDFAWPIAFVVLGLMVAIEMIVGNVIDPRLMAYSLNLSPLLVLVTLIFWGWLWGIVGMILAVPLTSMIKIIFDNLQPLRPVGALMAGSTSTGTVSDQPEEIQHDLEEAKALSDDLTEQA